MKATKIISACAVLVALASCSNDHVISQLGAEDTPIRIQANVGAVTTKAAANIQGEQFDRDEYINVYLFEKTGGTGTPKTYGNSGLVVFITTDANGNMSPDTPSDALYYPTNGQPVLAYAFYPALSSEPDYNIKKDATTFTVADDQSTEDAYKKSDLMFAKQEETAKNANPIKLTFVHQLTKIKVILQPGDGLTSITGATIKMLNVNKTIAISSIDPSTGLTFGTTSEPVSTGIDFGTVTSNEEKAIIIVPQKITPSGQTLFEVTYNGAKYKYNLDNSGTDIDFAAKTEYTYTLTLTSGGLEVKSLKISPWTPVTGGSGNAELDNN